MGRRKKSEKGKIKILKVIDSSVKKVEVIEKGSELEREINENEMRRGARFMRSNGGDVHVLGEGAVAGGGGTVTTVTGGAVREEKAFNYNMKSDNSGPKYVEAPRAATPIMRNETAGGGIRMDTGVRLPMQGRGFVNEGRRINPVAGMDLSEEKYEFRENPIDQEKKKKIL